MARWGAFGMELPVYFPLLCPTALGHLFEHGVCRSSCSVSNRIRWVPEPLRRPHNELTGHGPYGAVVHIRTARRQPASRAEGFVCCNAAFRSGAGPRAEGSFCCIAFSWGSNWAMPIAASGPGWPLHPSLPLLPWGLRGARGKRVHGLPFKGLCWHTFSDGQPLHPLLAPCSAAK